MTISHEQIEAIKLRHAWALNACASLPSGSSAGLKIAEALADTMPILSALEAAERRAGEAEARCNSNEISLNRIRARWRADPQMKTLDGVRARIAGMLPNDAVAIAETQERVLFAEAERDTLRARVERLEAGYGRLRLWFFRDHSMVQRVGFYKLAGVWPDGMSEDDEKSVNHGMERLLFKAALTSFSLTEKEPTDD
jgi:hypothetical protein